MGDNTNPVLVAEGGFNVPFLVRFKYPIEDRRPDLDEESAKEVLGYKYKTTSHIQTNRISKRKEFRCQQKINRSISTR